MPASVRLNLESLDDRTVPAIGLFASGGTDAVVVAPRLAAPNIVAFDYATSYELKPGCNPLLPTDPNFLKCYKSVGDFPEVNLSLTAIVTRFITAFGAGVQGIM